MLKNHSHVDCDRPAYLRVNASAASAAILLETRLTRVCRGRRRGRTGQSLCRSGGRDGGIEVLSRHIASDI